MSAARTGIRRRTWLLGALGATGALVLGWSVAPPRARLGDGSEWPAGSEGVALNGWIQIRPDGHVVLAMPRSEMGQGVHSALAQLAAEELDMPLAKLHLQQASGERLYGNVSMFVAALPLHPRDKHADPQPVTVRVSQWMVSKIARELGINATGGSSSVADAWEPVRLAAASARALLLDAAARRWQVPRDALRVSDGVVQGPAGQSAHWGELVADATGRKPESVQLKAIADFRLIGQTVPRADVPAVVFAQAQFGLDVRLPDMRFAALRMAPAIGGTLAQMDSAAALTMPGVEQVLPLPAADGSTAGFAVVARSWWQAEQAAERVQAQWQAPTAAADSAQIEAALRAAADSDQGFVFHERGDSDAVWNAPTGDKRRLEAQYSAPYLAHATLEPMNATAWVLDGRVEVWAPTQVPQLAQAAAARAAGVATERVTLHVTRLGGGFGRRLDVDVVSQAVAVAQATQGKPVQLIWSRQQDFTHDFYRPAMASRLQAQLGADGLPEVLRIRSAGDAIAPRWMARVLPALSGPIDTPDKTTAEGLFDLPYAIPHQRMAHVATRHPVPVGFWRSVGHSHNAFASECFVDELAALAGQDPMDYRLQLLQGQPRYTRVLTTVRSQSQWGQPLPAGQARGVALHESFGSVVAMVVHIERPTDAPLRVRRVDVAIDCGFAVNPDNVRAQMEGSVVFALTAALYGVVRFDQGAAQVSNFPDQPLLPLALAPEVHTYIEQSLAPPTGVGEPGVPPLAPALANAWAALTGQRLRQLPLRVPV
jgi:isoquinoline 1-oxidoreductase subunit beta